MPQGATGGAPPRPAVIEPGCPRITILVPTLARRERREFVLRALASIRSQDGVDATACIIVNGHEADPDLVTEMSRLSGAVLIRIQDQGIPAAFSAGRAQVTDEYFGALDDDDELLPGALATRMAAFLGDDTLDAVVTDGVLRSAAGDRRLREDYSEVSLDPVREMFRVNWLLPGSWLCRTDRVGEWLFRGMPPHRECTWIGLRLATKARLGFLPVPTVVYHEDSPGAAHRTLDYCLAQPAAIEQFLTLPLPSDVQKRLRRGMAAAHHEGAHRLLFEEGDRSAAWRWHLKSLRARGGYRHLLFTRKLFWPHAWLARAVTPESGGVPAGG